MSTVAPRQFAELMLYVQRLERGQDVILDELRSLRRAVERGSTHGLSDDDGRYTRLLVELWQSMGEVDLPFDASEVLDHSQVHHGLADALKACEVRDAAGLGALFRSLKGRVFGGWRLLRDSRAWRLERVDAT